jgi:hypothetical protein
VTVGGPTVGDPDIIIEQRDNRIQLRTKRFRTVIEPVTFRNEEPYLN